MESIRAWYGKNNSLRQMAFEEATERNLPCRVVFADSGRSPNRCLCGPRL
jgi:hypothetical protein